MTPTRGEGGVVRIPADLDRPDRILLGLSARQLAILTAGGLAAWILEGLLEPLVGLPAAVALAAPPGLVALALALGWREGLPLDRLAVAGLGWWRHPRRLVVAPDGIPMTSAWAGPPGPPVAPPAVALNRAIAIGEVHGAAAALALVDELDLDNYYPFYATRADLLGRLGRHREAGAAYQRAAAMAPTDAERAFLRLGGRGSR
jgi:tetratricopeptide (TPR) repeat protein